MRSLAVIFLPLEVFLDNNPDTRLRSLFRQDLAFLPRNWLEMIWNPKSIAQSVLSVLKFMEKGFRRHSHAIILSVADVYVHSLGLTAPSVLHHCPCLSMQAGCRMQCQSCVYWKIWSMHPRQRVAKHVPFLDIKAKSWRRSAPSARSRFASAVHFGGTARTS